MATQKAVLHQKRLTTTLTDEEYDLLEAFAAEQGIEDLERAIPAMIHELVRLHDQLWDAQFAQSTVPLDALGQEALDDDRAGLTEDLDT
jgi:hypothetical protein